MNITYTTLGEGKRTELLYNLGNGTNRKVATLNHDAARAAAQRLDIAHDTIANALIDVAVAYDGTPADARRRLLAEFDTTVTSVRTATDTVAVTDSWALAVDSIRRVATAVASEPDAVVAAVRRELADVILHDLDGILVAAVLVAEAYRPSYLKLVLNQYLGSWQSGGVETNPLFDALEVEALLTVERFAGLAVGTVIADDSYCVIDQLRDLRSAHMNDYAEANAVTVFNESGDDSPCLMANPSHLRAWLAANKPDLLARLNNLS